MTPNFFPVVDDDTQRYENFIFEKCVSLKMHSKNTIYDSRINRKCLYAPLTQSGRQAGIPSFIHACWHTIRLPSSLHHQQQKQQQLIVWTPSCKIREKIAFDTFKWNIYDVHRIPPPLVLICYSEPLSPSLCIIFAVYHRAIKLFQRGNIAIFMLP